jgi:hypothetical protein
MSASYDDLHVLRVDGTLAEPVGGVPPPAGAYSSLGAGTSFALAVVPAPHILTVVALVGAFSTRRRRNNTIR